MDILNTLKGTVGTVVDTVSTVAQNYVERNRTKAKLNRLRMVMKSESELMNRAYIALGKDYYEILKTGKGEPNERQQKLVEVIAGINTPAETVEKVIEISKQLGKVPVQVNEAAGFAVNRILVPMINEAINVYYTGTADIEGIDNGMKLGCNHPMGPLELGDFIGLDICLAIMDVLFEETHDNKYAASPLLRKMVRGKRLGVKTGIGFYDYSNGPRNKVPTDKK